MENPKSDHKREVLSIGFTKGMAAFGGGIVFIYFCFFGRIKFTNVKNHENKSHHVSSFILSHPNQMEKPKSGSKYSLGFTKGMAAFGGGILLHFLAVFWKEKLLLKPRSCQKLEKHILYFCILNFE